MEIDQIIIPVHFGQEENKNWKRFLREMRSLVKNYSNDHFLLNNSTQMNIFVHTWEGILLNMSNMSINGKNIKT